MKKLFTIALAAMLLSACGSKVENTPEAVADAFVEAWAKGDVETMIKFAAKDYAEEIADDVAELKEEGEYEEEMKELRAKEWKFNRDGQKVEMDGADDAEVHYLAREKGETAYEEADVSLEKDSEGKWKVWDFTEPYIRRR